MRIRLRVGKLVQQCEEGGLALIYLPPIELLADPQRRLHPAINLPVTRYWIPAHFGGAGAQAAALSAAFDRLIG